MTARQYGDPVPPCVPAQIHPEGWRLCSDATDHEAAARAHFEAAGDLLGEHLDRYFALWRMTVEPSGHQQDEAMRHLRRALFHAGLQYEAGNS